jgi:60 kDa SS-A/Ro ribonucleoprotein
MPSAKLFPSNRTKKNPTDTVNLAGGRAYSMPDRHALAQLAATGTLSRTFYATGKDQLDQVTEIVRRLFAADEHDYVLKTAVWSRERGLMKDVPGLLLTLAMTPLPGELQSNQPRYLSRLASARKAARRILTDPRMVRGVVQMARSGTLGRTSLGNTALGRLLRGWLEDQPLHALFAMNSGGTPSVQDIIKLVHPRPSTTEQSAMYAYLLGKPEIRQTMGDEERAPAAHLPAHVLAYESWKAGLGDGTLPKVPMAMLTSGDLSKADWKALAANMTWQQVRHNLNAMQRHDVFDDDDLVLKLAEKLANQALVVRARVMPHQILVAYRATGATVPTPITRALHQALDHSLVNVPEFKGRVRIAVDVSGSMSQPVTGYRGPQTSVVRNVDVAGLLASAVLRRSYDARVIPFDGQVQTGVVLNPMDSVLTNADKLAAVGGGSTRVSAPMQMLNQEQDKGDLVIYVSDYESWVEDAEAGGRWPRTAGTALMTEWEKYRARNPKAKLVCIDISPNKTGQAPNRDDILNIGGFGDSCFTIISDFLDGKWGGDAWTQTIEAIDLNAGGWGVEPVAPIAEEDDADVG